MLDAEGQPYEMPALSLLAKAAEGEYAGCLEPDGSGFGPRQWPCASGSGAGHAGHTGSSASLPFAGVFAQARWGTNDAVCGELLSQLGPDFGLLHAELIALFHRLAMTQLLGASPDPLAPDAEQLQSFATLFTAEELQLYYQIAITGRKEFPFAPDGRSSLEMTLLRMLAFSPRKSQASLPQSATLTPVAVPYTPETFASGSFPDCLVQGQNANTTRHSAGFWRGRCC